MQRHTSMEKRRGVSPRLNNIYFTRILLILFVELNGQRSKNGEV